MDLDNLIQEITPLYNSYKKEKLTLSGVQSLEVMWEVGFLLSDYIEKNTIAPHTLFWSIYGNAEGTKNIEKKSYVTREFLNRCYRIRRIFPKKQDIRTIFPNLRKFIPFREAMPFFDNPKYKLVGEEREKLLQLLNSKQSQQQILKRIKQLQKEKIGIKNPRTQRLHELEGEKQIFIRFYNATYRLLKEGNYELVKQEIGEENMDYVKILSKNISALSQEGLKFYEFKIPQALNELWKNFSQVVKEFASQKTAKERRRFRRLISPERIVQLSDMLYALVSKENYKNFKT
jgi:hypothetical protein